MAPHDTKNEASAHIEIVDAHKKAARPLVGTIRLYDEDGIEIFYLHDRGHFIAWFCALQNLGYVFAGQVATAIAVSFFCGYLSDLIVKTMSKRNGGIS
ncbi:hypothetical protein G6011_08277 [Alternaria panax]|uniref:Uncharacterized protein n=1 Tax=Alternaria panax TaxID=48097 RepID=A0AAD4FMA1_9PLEO|nr:hypothetical protein G6011_08277 [Alternaria panax]